VDADRVARYIVEHPGSRAEDIANAAVDRGQWSCGRRQGSWSRSVRSSPSARTGLRRTSP